MASFRFEFALTVIQSLRDHLPNVDNFPHNLCGNRLGRRVLVEGLRKRLSRRRVVFCINPGRTGSAFLCQLLGSAREVHAHHEPVPRMTGGYLSIAMKCGMKATYGKRQIKIMGINLCLSRMPPGAVYVETNHMFIKTFYDVTMDYYASPEVVILRRDLRLTLKSFVELGYFSDATRQWRLWMHEPGLSHYVKGVSGPGEGMDQYDRCIEYLLDIEARARLFRSQYPNVPVHECELEGLRTVSGARRLFDALGLEWSTQTEEASSRVVNERNERKRLLNRQVSVDYCAERIHRYLVRARAVGCKPPDVQIPLT